MLVVKSQAGLRRVLREDTDDLRAVDGVRDFRRWLGRHLEAWEHDRVYAQRVRLRAIRQAHPTLRTVEKMHRRLQLLDEKSPAGAELARLERELHAVQQAIAGLTAARAERPSRAAALDEKLRGFQAREVSVKRHHDALLRQSPLRIELMRAEEELAVLRRETGLAQEEAALEALLTSGGRRSGHAGKAFEHAAIALTEELLVPALLDGEHACGVCILRSVTLGAARTELDHVVVRRARDEVDVLGIIEVKRNPNDLAHGHRRRKENIAWLTGQRDAYDAAEYRTAQFRAGHFDRPAFHDEAGERLTFTPRSFARFVDDPCRLCFVSRVGPLWGLSAAALARVQYRVATDADFDPDDSAWLERLLAWSKGLANDEEAPDVLRLYAASRVRAQRMLLVR